MNLRMHLGTAAVAGEKEGGVGGLLVTSMVQRPSWITFLIFLLNGLRVQQL